MYQEFIFKNFWVAFHCMNIAAYLSIILLNSILFLHSFPLFELTSVITHAQTVDPKTLSMSKAEGEKLQLGVGGI